MIGFIFESKELEERFSWIVNNFFSACGLTINFNDENNLFIYYGKEYRKINGKPTIFIPSVDVNDFNLSLKKFGRKEILLLEKSFYDENKEYSVPFDIFLNMEYFLNLNEEKYKSANKSWGVDSPRYKTKFLNIAVVESYVDCFFPILEKAAKKEKLPIPYKKRWPNDAKYAVCLTHDIDNFYESNLLLSIKYFFKSVSSFSPFSIVNSLGFVKKSFISSLIGKPTKILHYFNEMKEMENKHGVKSTYFFIPLRDNSRYAEHYDVYDKNVALEIKKLIENGFGVGVHSSFNSFNNFKRLKYESDSLFSRFNIKTKGMRAHYLHVDRNSLANFASAEFNYDTSFGYNDIMGFRIGSSLPIFYENKVFELPQIIMDNHFYEFFEVNSNIYFNEKKEDNDANRWNLFLKVLKNIYVNNGLLTINWHNISFSKGNEKGAFFEKMLVNFKKDKAFIANADYIYGWWVDRDAVKLDCIKKGRQTKFAAISEKNIENLCIGFIGSSKKKTLKIKKGRNYF